MYNERGLEKEEKYFRAVKIICTVQCVTQCINALLFLILYHTNLHQFVSYCVISYYIVSKHD